MVRFLQMTVQSLDIGSSFGMLKPMHKPVAGCITPKPNRTNRSRCHDHCNMDELLHVVVNRAPGSVW